MLQGPRRGEPLHESSGRAARWRSSAAADSAAPASGATPLLRTASAADREHAEPVTCRGCQTKADLNDDELLVLPEHRMAPVVLAQIFHERGQLLLAAGEEAELVHGEELVGDEQRCGNEREQAADHAEQRRNVARPERPERPERTERTERLPRQRGEPTRERERNQRVDREQGGAVEQRTVRGILRIEQLSLGRRDGGRQAQAEQDPDPAPARARQAAHARGDGASQPSRTLRQS